MHGFRDNEVLLQAGYDVIISPPIGALHALVLDGFWKCNHDFMIVIHSNVLSACIVSEIKRFYCKSHVTSSWFFHQEALHAIFMTDSERATMHDFPIVIHSNFLSAMHGFRDNEVLLLTGYDVIFGPPPGGATHTFSWQILKERL